MRLDSQSPLPSSFFRVVILVPPFLQFSTPGKCTISVQSLPQLAPKVWTACGDTPCRGFQPQYQVLFFDPHKP